MPSLSLHSQTPHVYWTLPDEATDRPVLGIIIGKNASLMVEAGASPRHARQFFEALSVASMPPPALACVTHWHWDHVFGISELDQPVFAHVETTRAVRRLAALDWRDAALNQRVQDGGEIAFCRDHMIVEMTEGERERLKIRTPEVSFHDRIEIDLGGVTAHLIHVGGDHSSDSTIVYVPEDGVVFLGDCLYSNLYNEPPSYTVEQLFPLLDRLLSLDAQYYLPSHCDAQEAYQPMTRAGLEADAALMRSAGVAVSAGKERAAAIAGVQAAFPAADPEFVAYYVDCFIAGLG